MKARPLLIATAILSSIVGGVVVYLLLSVPNDLRADALLTDARREIKEGRPLKAREALTKVIQQYPRTDAAAAATIALVALADQDREAVAQSIALLRRQNEQQTVQIANLQQIVAEMRKPPPPPAPTVGPPAPKPVVKKPPAKKPAPKKKTTRRRG
jgi:hypothetical protein